MKFGKKGVLGLEILAPAAIAFGVAVIVMSLVGTVLSDLKETQNQNTTAYNISAKGEEGIFKMAKQTPTIGTVIGIVVVLVIVLTAFARFSS